MDKSAAPLKPQIPMRAARSARALFSLLTVSLLALNLSAFAQTDDEVVHVRTDLIIVPVVVTDTHNRRVAGLAQTDFALSNDGRIVPISFFAAGATRVALLFALDASGSIRENIERQRAAALALFDEFGHNSQVAVLTFDERAKLTLPFTADAEQARAAFKLEVHPEQHTAIFDAALAAVRAFDARPTDARERHIAIILSDGLDTASQTRAADVIAAANERAVTFYVVHLPLFAPQDGKLSVRRPARGFRELAERTGGQYFLAADERAAFEPRNARDLAPVFRAIAADLQTQYLLGFYLDAQGREPRTHRITVNLTGKKLRVRQLRETYTVK
jgi:Ca-activated chloride channel homolog